MANKSTADSPSKIIDELGGTNAVASMVGVTAPAVSNWRRTGIPARNWAILVAKSAGRATFERLAALHSAQSEAA